MTLFFEIPLRAKAKQSTRFSRRGCFTDKKLKNYQAQVKWLLRNQYRKPLISQPVKVDIKAFFKIPKKYHKQAPLLIGKPYPKMPDSDNIAKCFLDCLKGIVIEDDRIATEKRVVKVYGLENRVEIRLEVIT